MKRIGIVLIGFLFIVGILFLMIITGWPGRQVDTVVAPDHDTTPPTFNGLGTVYSCDGGVGLAWRQAQDESLPVIYQVFMSKRSGNYDWKAPILETLQTQTSIQGLENNTPYFFVVRAKDARGNGESNLKEEVVMPASEGAYPGLPYRELIFKEGFFPSAHAASIIELPGGELLVVWNSEADRTMDRETARRSKKVDTAIWSSRKPAGSSEWTTPEIIQDAPGIPDRNPVLYLNPNNQLWLFWVFQEEFKWRKSVLKSKMSDDFGRTWGPIHNFGTNKGTLPKTHLLTLHNGWVILPLYIEQLASSLVVISKDGGQNWGKPHYILPFFGIQPTIIQRSDLSLYALMRSGGAPNKAWYATSDTLGQNWKNRWVSEIKNPGSCLEMIKLHNGHVLLVFNDSKTERTNLKIALSYDEGKSWARTKTIEDGPEMSSYPSIIQDHCGLIHVAYSYNNLGSIAHFVANESWIESE